MANRTARKYADQRDRARTVASELNSELLSARLELIGVKDELRRAEERIAQYQHELEMQLDEDR